MVNRGDKAILLIHGSRLSWNMWSEYVDYLSQDYFLILPVLEGYDFVNTSVFTTIEYCAAEIEEFCHGVYGDGVFAVCGFSLGGTIAALLYERKNLHFDKLVIESASLVPLNWVERFFYRRFFLYLVYMMQNGSGLLRVCMGRIYPKFVVDDLFLLSTVLSVESVNALCDSLFSYRFSKDNVMDDGVDIVYWCGGCLHEFHSRRSGRYLSGFSSRVDFKVFKGYCKGELVLSHPNQYIEELETFLNINHY